MAPCPFCEIEPERLVWSGPLVVALRDGYPVSPGHTLIVPRRHIASWFDVTPDEQSEIWRAVGEIKSELDRMIQPDGYNIGINAGEAAGQTVMHVHVHVVPRFKGDVDDPAGGVRFVIPAYGNYRSPGRLPRPAGDPPPWYAPAGSSARLATGWHDPFDHHLRPALREAREVAIVAAFVQGSGVEHLHGVIDTALERGACFRVITGDYLQITQSRALRRLLDWSRTATSAEHPDRGTFDVRVVETAKIGGRSFHPKSWRIESATQGIAWVGSSNWSRMALTAGVEWNLRVDRSADPDAYAEIVTAFDSLWRHATPLSEEWLRDYSDRARQQNRPPVLGESEDIELDGPYEPIGVQPDALDALARSRAERRARALVVLATGLGKTFLAAFDVRAMAAASGRMPRVLFIAHRRELLIQASRTFRKVFPDASIGFFVGGASDLDTDLVFASIQKLARGTQLAALAPEHFDYVIVDESHHAPAASYRQVLGMLAPAFLLGLTATPERADQADVAGLFDDHVAFRADLGQGIELGRLVPFDYAGLPDTIEFEAIPWRRYTADQLAALAETEARMERLHEAWSRFPGTRTIVFCVTIHHADYVRDWLSERGVRIVACHSGPGSADRDTSLEQLKRGELDAVAAVDLFNEGIDVPLIDRVVMLRPTASPVVFLQQLGRGLRVAEGKERLQVIDLIGNHKAFLNKIRTLLSLAPNATSPGQFLRDGSGRMELRAGCRVNVDLEVIEMLRKFLPSGSKNETIRVYRELRDAREARPTPGELVRLGMSPRSIKAESWFAFVQDEGDLSELEVAAFEHVRRWFRHLEVSAMTKSFKMVTLEVMLDGNALFEGIELQQLAARCHEALERDPTLRADIDGVDAFAAGPDSGAWMAYWRKNPIAAWIRGPWFEVVDGRLTFCHPPPEGASREAFIELTRELVDMRLATYRRRSRPSDDSDSSFVCKVISNKRHPILKLPDRGRARLPQGETDVRLDDGRVWQFSFRKIACNVARPIGSRANALPDLLYGWFGPSAGKPGTAFRVRFRRSPEGWWAEPFGVVIELPPRGEIVSFPSLHAAAGASGKYQEGVEADTVRLPFGGEARFAVRASGSSMDGGKRPIRDGDWVIMQWARGLGLDAVAGRVCLIEMGDGCGGYARHLKRVAKGRRGIELRSDNPLELGLEPTEDTQVIARLIEVVRPETLAPARGAVVVDVGEAFELSEAPPPGISRVDGHLFLLVDEPGALASPGRLKWPVSDRGASETAFVLTAAGSDWRYAGVGRWGDDAWVFPAVDFTTWRALGSGRGASRLLDPFWESAAENLVGFLDGRHSVGDWLEARSRRCRFKGRAARGGVRIDHEHMAERTVSVLDLGWVLQAADRAAENGGRVDEAWVNALRYLDGTPKASTRWVEAGWALVILEHAVRAGFVASRVPVEGEHFQVTRDGQRIDATTHIDRSVAGRSIVLEARGGTSGSAGARNTAYSEGLEVLLTRLAAAGAVLDDVYVDSRALSALPLAHRRLDVGEGGLPLTLTLAGASELASQLGRSMALVGRDPDAKGSGNSTRRIRLVVTVSKSLESVLGGPPDGGSGQG